MKKLGKILFLILVLFVNISKSECQTDTLFWFAAPDVNHGGGSFDIPIVLRFSTLNLTSQVTIDIPANASFVPITININPNSTQTVDLSTWLNLIESRPPNQVLNKGLRIRSTTPISAYYEIVSSYCNCNPEIFALKGDKALGNKFYTPFQDTFRNGGPYTYSPTPYSAFDIVATEDNTTIQITPTNDVVGNTANTTFTITLNKGQSYSATATSIAADKHLGGSKIESNKPIAVTIKDDMIGFRICADIAGDQLIPIDYIGSEYIVMKGFLEIPDRVHILSTEDNTQVFVGGNLVTTINEGETYVYKLSAGSIYINSSKNVYVMHLSGFGCEIGIAVLPPVECTGSKQVGFTRSSINPFYLMIIVETGGEGSFVLNGLTTSIVAVDFNVVPGSGGAWKFATKQFSQALIPQASASLLSNSTHRFHMGIIHGTANNGTRYGYFSDFGSVRTRAYAQKNTLCEGDTLLLLGKTFNTNNYSWTGPNNFTSNDINPTIENVSQINEGFYYFSTPNPECGTGTDSIYISVNNKPDKPLTSNNSPICLGDKLKIELLNKPGFAHRTIWLNNSLDSIASGDSLLINPITSLNSGPFAVRYKELAGGCLSDSSFIEIDYSPKPIQPVLTSLTNKYCEFEQVVINNDTTLNPDDAYEWSGPNNFLSSQFGEITLDSVQASHSGFYKLVITGLEGCKTEIDSIEITILPYPDISLVTVSSNSPVCVNDSLVIDITSPQTDLDFSWEGPLGFVSNQARNVMYNTTTDMSGEYFITIGNDICILDDTLTLAIEVFVKPDTPLLSTSPKYCEFEQVIIQNTGTNNPTDIFQWRGPNNFSSNESDQLTLNNVQASQSGFYSLHITNDLGCESEVDSIEIEVIPYPDFSQITATSNSPICSGQLLTFEANSTENDIDYSWKGPLGFSSNQANNNINNTTTSISGFYLLTVGRDICELIDTLSLDVVVNQSPVSAFGLSKQFADAGLPFDFINQSTFAVTYSWDFGDLSPRSSQTNPSHIFVQENTYSIMLIAFNQDSSCVDTSFNSLAVFNKDEGVYTPTGFSPNKDGSNDVFRVYASGIMPDITLEIYNRWGELLFITEDAANKGWDGTYMDKDCPEGIYVYIVTYKDRQGIKKMSRGTLTLLR